MSEQTIYRVELASSGVWLVFADDECLADAAGHQDWSSEQAQTWATDVIQAKKSVWVHSWTGAAPVFSATAAADHDPQDMADRRRRYLRGEDNFEDRYSRDQLVAWADRDRRRHD